MSEERDRLEEEIMELFLKRGFSDPKLKGEVFMCLDKYEISKRTTEIAIREEDHVVYYCRGFLASKRVQGCTQRTIDFYGKTLRSFFDDVRKNPEDIVTDDIRRYMGVKQVRDKNCMTTIQNISRVLSSFYAWMITEEHMERNPTLKIGRIKKAKTKKEAFSDMDIEKIRQGCRTWRETALIEILLSTGCRVSEVTKMQRTEIDGDEIIVHGKGNKDRQVYLNAKAQLALKNYLSERNDKNTYIFPKSSTAIGENCMVNKLKPSDMKFWYRNEELVDEQEPQDKSAIESIVRKIGERAGVKNVHPHRFRRTCATMALRHGMPIELVSQMLGHENISTTQIYLDIGESELKNAHKKYVI